MFRINRNLFAKLNAQRLAKQAAVGAGLALVAVSSFATGPDFSTLTAGVDYSTVVTAILAIAGLVAVVYVAMKGARMVLGMLKAA